MDWNNKLSERIVRPVRYYSVKEWKKFKRVHEKWVGNTVYYLDVQEVLCKKFDIILTDHRTSRKKAMDIIKAINFRNFDRGMKVFDDAMREFDQAMADFGKELGDGNSNNKPALWGTNNQRPNRNDRMIIWGTSDVSKINRFSNIPKIYGLPKKIKTKKHRKKKRKKKNAKSDVEKLIGKRKPIF